MYYSNVISLIYLLLVVKNLNIEIENNADNLPFFIFYLFFFFLDIYHHTITDNGKLPDLYITISIAVRDM